MVEKTYDADFQSIYEISQSLELIHYKHTKEFALVNADTGEEFLIAEDYEEAKVLCELILSLIKEE